MTTIERNWQLGLDVLRPSEKDLQHGLELHRSSFVFDAYGFFPLPGAKADERFKDMLANGASRDELAYAAHQLAADKGMDDPAMVEEMRNALEFAGVNALFQNSGEESNNIERLVKRLGIFQRLTDRFPEYLTRAAFPDRISQAYQNGKFAIYPTTNGVPLPSTMVSSAESLNWIEVFFGLGVRMMHLTYNRRNLFGDGCAESADAGLSQFGRDAIAEMNRVGVICDVAHSGLRTSYEAAKFSKKPMVASHAVALAVNRHARAKSDEVIQAIKESGGFVGICAYPAFLGGSCKIDAFIDHIDYVARKFGVDHVAVGTDHGHTLSSREIPAGNSNRPTWEQYWREDIKLAFARDDYDSMAWTNWPLFTVGLVQRGYTDEEIRKIIGGNVLRVCQEVLA